MTAVPVAGVGRRGPPDPRVRSRRLLARAVGFAVLVPLWFLFLAPRSIGGPLSVIWVSGISMEPTLYTGDLSILRRAEHYEVGDIVAFDIPEGGTVIHRVITIHPDGYEFQGDNRDTPDQWILDRSAIRGRQVFAIPGFAEAMAKLRRPGYFAGLVAALVVLVGLGKP